MTATTDRMIIIVAALFLLHTTMPCSACRCFENPTLETMIQDESTTIFHGIVVPRLFLFWSDDNPRTTKDYSVWITKVYKQDCYSETYVISPPPAPAAAEVLNPYQRITISTSIDSCGIPPLPLFRSFLFSSVVSEVSQDGSRMLLQQAEAKEVQLPITAPASIILATSKNITSNVRSTVGKRRQSAPIMNVNMCGNYIQPWRSVTKTEKDLLLHNGVVSCNRW